MGGIFALAQSFFSSETIVACFPSYQTVVPRPPSIRDVKASGRRTTTWRVSVTGVFWPPGPTFSDTSSAVKLKFFTPARLLLISRRIWSPLAFFSSAVFGAGPAQATPSAAAAERIQMRVVMTGLLGECVRAGSGRSRPRLFAAEGAVGHGTLVVLTGWG